jgi:type II secretory pathway component GspD/PulD (secretin)
MFVKKRMSVLAVALVLPLFGGAALAQVPSVDARVTLNIADKSLEEIVKSLRDRSGSNIVIIDPLDKAKISTAKVSIEVFDVGWRDALELVAEKAGCVVEERPGGVLAVTKPPEVTIEFQDRDIRQVIETIAAVSGASITLGKEVSGNITVRFKDVPWRVALDVTAKTLGFVVVEEKRGVLRVVSPDTLKDQLDTRTYQLRYLRPQSIFKPTIKSEFVQAQQQQQQSAQGKGGQIDYTKTFTVLLALEKAPRCTSRSRRCSRAWTSSRRRSSATSSSSARPTPTCSTWASTTATRVPKSRSAVARSRSPSPSTRARAASRTR